MDACAFDVREWRHVVRSRLTSSANVAKSTKTAWPVRFSLTDGVTLLLDENCWTDSPAI